MVLIKVVVDELPKGCGKCSLMDYINDRPVCLALRRDDYDAELEGNPYGMDYRRSDCPLEEAR